MSELFPDDENGEVLRRMKGEGDDLAKPRDVDFSVVFANESAARSFSQHFRDLGYRADFRKSDVRHDLPWDVTVVNFLTPSHSEITEFELMLERIAAPLGGQNDGWGCFQQ